MNHHKYNLPNNCAHSVLFLLQCKYSNPTSLINFINCKTFTVKRRHRKNPFFQQPIIPFSPRTQNSHKCWSWGLSPSAHQILERLSALHPAEMNEPVTEVCWGWTGRNSTLPWGEDNSEGVTGAISGTRRKEEKLEGGGGGVRGYHVEQREQRAEKLPSVYLNSSSSQAQFPDLYLRKEGAVPTSDPSNSTWASLQVHHVSISPQLRPTNTSFPST